MADKYSEMADIFGADFETDEEDKVVTNSKSKEEISQQLAVKTQNEVAIIPPENKIANEDYIKQEYLMGVEILNDAVDTMRSDLTSDDRPSKWEAFATLMKERRETIAALEHSNEATYKRNKETKDEPTGNVTNNNIVMTNREMLESLLGLNNTGLDPNKEV